MAVGRGFVPSRVTDASLPTNDPSPAHSFSEVLCATSTSPGKPGSVRMPGRTHRTLWWSSYDLEVPGPTGDSRTLSRTQGVITAPCIFPPTLH